MTELPTTMNVVEISRPGGPDVLTPARRPVPQPAEGEVLIRVQAAGVNRPDVLQRLGLYRVPPDASDLPGLEAAGEIVAVGEGVARWRIGNRVCALLNGGGYADFALAPAGQVLPWPIGLTAVEAASIPETYFTVWHNLFERGHAKDGDWVLVHGGTSGIGVTALQLGTAFGLNIIATAGSDDKCAFCLSLGARAAINYKSADFAKEVKAITSGRGVDVVLDMVGGDYVPRNLSCLVEDGRHVSIAVQRGASAEVNFFDMMRRRLTLTGSTLRPRTAVFKAELAQSLEREVWPLLAAGTLKPVIDSQFALADAAAAHARMETSLHHGKIILVVEGAA